MESDGKKQLLPRANWPPATGRPQRLVSRFRAGSSCAASGLSRLLVQAAFTAVACCTFFPAALCLFSQPGPWVEFSGSSFSIDLLWLAPRTQSESVCVSPAQPSFPSWWLEVPRDCVSKIRRFFFHSKLATLHKNKTSSTMFRWHCLTVIIMIISAGRHHRCLIFPNPNK